VLRQQTSILHLIHTNLGYGTVLTVAFTHHGCSATSYYLVVVVVVVAAAAVYSFEEKPVIQTTGLYTLNGESKAAKKDISHTFMVFCRRDSLKPHTDCNPTFRTKKYDLNAHKFSIQLLPYEI
jgi:hypothetical protein